jgi:hypothetical protein
MPLQKTSKAEYFHARLNPKNAAELRVLEIIEEQKPHGINFKMLAVNGILKAQGEPIERFKAETIDIAGAIEPLLKQFAEAIISEMRQRNEGGRVASYDDDNDAPAVQASAMTRRFLSGLQQRQQTALGDGE